MSDAPAATWLVPSNPRTFDADAAFRAARVVDWSETRVQIHPGDIVLLYGARPISALTHQCFVEVTGIPGSRALDDTRHWRNDEALESRQRGTVMRLGLVQTFDAAQRAQLSLANLKRHGLKAAPQGRMRASVEITQLIEQVRGPLTGSA